MTERYESRASTHADDCWAWGPGHYECAVGKIGKLVAELREMNTERLRLRDEGDALREDAERYRWLRKGAGDDVAVVRGLGAMDYGMSAVVYTYSEEIDGDDLDAAIDDAMRKEGRGDE